MPVPSELTLMSQAENTIIFELRLTAERMDELGLEIACEYQDDGPDTKPVLIRQFVQRKS